MADAGAPVAVAIVSWNTRDLLDRCLRSVLPEVEAGRAEAWVVDNASTDGSAEMVRERHGFARLVALERNAGFGAAVNRVARATAAPWIAPANADVELQPGALETLLEAGERDGGAGAVAPRLLLPGGRTQHSVYRFPTLPFLAAVNLGLGGVVPQLGDELCLVGRWDPERPRTVDWAVGAFLIVRRRAFEEAGGFDEEQWLFAEDLDLGWRLARRGWTTRYEPGAVVVHHESAATGAAWGEERTERWLRSTYAWMLRRRGRARARVAAAMNVAGSAARAAALSVAARVWPGRFAWPRDVHRRWARLHRATGFAPRAELERHR